MNKAYALITTTFLCVASSAIAADKLLPSQQPPAGLPADLVPQLVSLGFDDNNESVGINWTLQAFEGLTNPAGLGNPNTFDGQAVKASFFPVCAQSDQNPSILDSWNKIWKAGHEIGNHTFNHDWGGQAFSQAQWEQELLGCINRLSAPWKADGTGTGAGIPQETIQGFRAPFGIYNNDTFKAIKATGLSYDVSIQEGMQSDQDSSNYFWPYTLDEGSPASQFAWWGPNVTQHPGIWALPVHMLEIIPDDKALTYGIDYSLLTKIHETETLKKFNWTGNKLTAVDYNLFSNSDWMYDLTKQEAMAILKYNLDKRMAGNRVPLVLGFHTDYLSDSALSHMTNTTPQERREVVTEFLKYALSKKAVRIVRHIDVINWMRNPSKLIICNDKHWSIETEYTAGDRVTYQGHLWTAKWWNKLEVPLAKSWSVWQDEGKCVEN